MKLRTAMLVLGFISLLLPAVPQATAQTATQTLSGALLSEIELHPAYSYIGRAKFNADKSGRLEDDYFGYPVSRAYPAGEGKNAPGLPQSYYVTAKVRNAGSKNIKAVGWEMTFFRDPARTEKLGCLATSVRGQVKPGRTKELKQHASGLLLRGRASAHRDVNLRWVQYADGTVWQSFDYLKVSRDERGRCRM
ncbi:MAG TPA: hypothetical protein VEZ40_18375 [Pyrinomonadaceae bacterium]|nr:hypothetical protein [Pyrinomonadaceae bacterium]